MLRVLWRDDMIFPLSYRKETCEKGRCSAVVVTAGWSFRGLTIGGLHDAGVCVSAWKPSHWCHLRTLRMHRALRQACHIRGCSVVVCHEVPKVKGEWRSKYNNAWWTVLWSNPWEIIKLIICLRSCTGFACHKISLVQNSTPINYLIKQQICSDCFTLHNV